MLPWCETPEARALLPAGTRIVAPPTAISIAAAPTTTDAKLTRCLSNAEPWPACRRQPNAVDFAGCELPSGTVTFAPGETGIPCHPDADRLNLSIAATDAAKAEGKCGTTPFTFTVSLDQPRVTSQSINWSINGSGDHAANGADFAGGVLPSGTVACAAGETSKTIP